MLMLVTLLSKLKQLPAEMLAATEVAVAAAEAGEELNAPSPKASRIV